MNEQIYKEVIQSMRILHKNIYHDTQKGFQISLLSWHALFEEA